MLKVNDTKDNLEEMTFKAIKHCETHQCNGCPYKEHASYCVAILECLIKAREGKKVKIVT